MLPDYPQLKEDIQGAFDDYVRRKTVDLLGPVGELPSTRIFEGDKWVTELPDGSRNTSKLTETKVEVRLKKSDIPYLEPHDIKDKLDQIAHEFAQKQADQFIKILSEATARSGQIIDNKGKPITPETILKYLESHPIEFNEKGEFEGLLTIISPHLAEAFKIVIKAIMSTPELRKKHDEIIEMKREQWRVREANRKLVG